MRKWVIFQGKWLFFLTWVVAFLIMFNIYSAKRSNYTALHRKVSDIEHRVISLERRMNDK